MCWGLKVAEINSRLVMAETYRKLLLTHIHPLKPWLPTPTSMCSVTFDTNLLTEVMQKSKWHSRRFFSAAGRHSLTWIRFSQMSNTGKETVRSNGVT